MKKTIVDVDFFEVIARVDEEMNCPIIGGVRLWGNGMFVFGPMLQQWRVLNTCVSFNKPGVCLVLEVHVKCISGNNNVSTSLNKL